MTLPQRKPDWLRLLLANYEQLEQTVRHHINTLEQLIADQGIEAPAHASLSLHECREDLAEVLQQQAVLEAGWNAINTAP